jgi:hypothetical protein
MKQEMKFVNFKDIEKSIEFDVWLIKTSPHWVVPLPIMY